MWRAIFWIGMGALAFVQFAPDSWAIDIPHADILFLTIVIAAAAISTSAFHIWHEIAEINDQIAGRSPDFHQKLRGA